MGEWKHGKEDGYVLRNDSSGLQEAAAFVQGK